MSSNILNLNYTKFINKYRDDWKAGNISQESIDELIDILDNLNIDFSISYSVSWTIKDLVRLLIRYRFDKDCQSIDWIEPIRMDNWKLHLWIEAIPELIDYKYDQKEMWLDVTFSFYYLYNHDEYAERTSDDLKTEIAKEFTVKNLADIDYIEKYLRTYAKTDKVKRYLQMI